MEATAHPNDHKQETASLQTAPATDITRQPDQLETDRRKRHGGVFAAKFWKKRGQTALKNKDKYKVGRDAKTLARTSYDITGEDADNLQDFPTCSYEKAVHAEEVSYKQRRMQLEQNEAMHCQEIEKLRERARAREQMRDHLRGQYDQVLNQKVLGFDETDKKIDELQARINALIAEQEELQN